MSVNDLYREIVLRHFKQPSNYGKVADAEVLAEVENTNCGDRFRLTLAMEQGRIGSIRFDGKGCAISVASCSLMTERVLGKTADEARSLRREFEAMLKEERPASAAVLGDLMALESIRRYPLRLKCALLGWDGLDQALRKVPTDHTD
ncbi:MAG: SUF system NifU family Fe-S cluster assembly protein [Kiritimatiellae bacterium]|nr:SUF system NifU family Fe-S cluster assembly protein [Kiritimatiellia bacterium]